MAACMMVGKCVGVRNYMKKDGKPGCNAKIADNDGNIFEMLGNGTFPTFPFGTEVTVSFDVGFFNGKPSNFYMTNIIEAKGIKEALGK